MGNRLYLIAGSMLAGIAALAQDPTPGQQVGGAVETLLGDLGEKALEGLGTFAEVIIVALPWLIAFGVGLGVIGLFWSKVLGPFLSGKIGQGGKK